MLQTALQDGTAQRQCVFEVFARRLPAGRRYGVVAGTARLIEAIDAFRFSNDELSFLAEHHIVDDQTLEWLGSYEFRGEIDGYPEGELYFPYSPVVTVQGTFAEAVLLETLTLSVLNYDSAIAAASARMISAAGDRPIIEMGSRRTHECAAPAAARAAYLAGFSATSNLYAGQLYGIPTAGTAAHAFTLLHDEEIDAFAAQIAALGPDTTLLVDTYDIATGIRRAIDVAGGDLGSIRIDSGDLAELARQSRELLDKLGATNTRILLSGDLDEFAIAALAVAPVDAYGVGTAVVTGSGAPTAEMVYKLVEVEGKPVVKRSENKATVGGRKTALRRYKPTGTAVEEIIVSQPDVQPAEGERLLQVPFVRGGEPVSDISTLDQAKAHLHAAMVTLPWEGLKLSAGDPAIPTVLSPRHTEPS